MDLDEKLTENRKIKFYELPKRYLLAEVGLATSLVGSFSNLYYKLSVNEVVTTEIMRSDIYRYTFVGILGGYALGFLIDVISSEFSKEFLDSFKKQKK